MKETTRDPATYAKMSKPISMEEIEKHNIGLHAALAKLRKKHHLAELVVLGAWNTDDGKHASFDAQWGNSEIGVQMIRLALEHRIVEIMESARKLAEPIIKSEAVKAEKGGEV